DAAPSVEHRRTAFVPAQQRAGGTGVHAPVTAAAVIPLEGGVEGKIDVQQDGAEEEVRSASRLDEYRVATEPAEPRPLRQLPLQHRPCVHVGPPASGEQFLADPILQANQPLLQQIVVVVVARVPREYAARGILL